MTRYTQYTQECDYHTCHLGGIFVRYIPALGKYEKVLFFSNNRPTLYLQFMFLSRSSDMQPYKNCKGLDVKWKYEIKLKNVFEMTPEMQVGPKSSCQQTDFLFCFFGGLISVRMKKKDNVIRHFFA